MHLERLWPSEIDSLRKLIGRKVLFFAQDICDFAIVGEGWQLSISSDNVYKGDIKYFEISGLRVKTETIPAYTSRPEHGFAYVPVAANTIIRDVRIVYHQWQDEWTSDSEQFTLRLEGGVLIETDDGMLVAILWPYDFAYTYPFSELNQSVKALTEALDAWASSYEIVSVSGL